jgi:hypothetical protein
MITIFNRKLLLSTTDIEKYANAKDDLAAAKILFATKVQSTSGSHNITKTPDYYGGRAKNNSGLLCEIFVHEDDFDRAVYVINHRP